MNLTIGKLVANGKIPRSLRVDGTLVSRVAREGFVAECSSRLRRQWHGQPKVARIRRLQVNVSVPAAQFSPETLAAAWATAFVRELAVALAHQKGGEILHFESRSEYLGACIRDLAN
jgi:hypothetical protein